MLSPARNLKFCGAWARVACVILVDIASRVTFHGFFKSTSTNHYSTVQRFSGAKDSSLSRFLFLIVTPCCKYSKKMLQWIFFSLIFTPCCKYTYSKNNVKFLQLTSSELLQKLLKLSRIVCCFKLLFYFRIIFVV